MKRGWIWVALLLSVGINVGVLATLAVSRSRIKARWEEPQRIEERRQPFARVANFLELEGETRERFLEIQQRLFRQTREHQESLQQLRSELRREIVDKEPDRARVDELLASIAEIHGDLDRLMVESVLATRDLLTAEQQRRYLGVLERMREARRLAGRDGQRSRPQGRRPPPPRPEDR